LSQGILIKNFVWLPYTILADSYSNHHFLYHLILVPFAHFFDPLFSVKIATLIFATLFLVLFYWLLKRFKIKFAFFYAFLVLTVPAFLTRINLAKAPSIALIFLFLGFYALFKRRYFLLAIVSFFYVWLYNTWPILLAATIIHCFSSAFKKLIDHWQEIQQKIKNRKEKIKNKNKKQKNISTFLSLYFCSFIFYFLYLVRCFLKKDNLKLLSVCFLGIIAGLVINPYFPQNLYFNWVHIVKIGLKNYQNILPVGAEWYPFEPISLIQSSPFIFLLWFFALAWFLVSFKKNVSHPYFSQKKEALTFFILSILFFIYTIKSRRNIEYFVPFAILFTAFSFNKLFLRFNWQEYFAPLKNWLKFPFNLISLILVGLISIIFVFALSYFSEKVWLAKRNEFKGGASFDQFKKVSQFLKEKTSVGEIIFHSSWDEFPALFYHNEKNYYIAGLDPTFMYEKNKSLYWVWYNIVRGKQKKYLAETIKENFQAQYVFVRIERKEMIENLSLDKNFEKIYEDEEGRVYKIKDEK